MRVEARFARIRGTKSHRHHLWGRPLTPHTTGTRSGLSRLNALPRPSLERELHGCLGVNRWSRDVADRQPYDTVDELRTVADEAARTLTSGEVDEALSGHPRIGERPEGPNASASRTEQAGVDRQDRELADALYEGNVAYEERFGHIFLICASELSGEEILTQLRARLANDAETERRVVADELRKITLLRVERLLAP